MQETEGLFDDDTVFVEDVNDNDNDNDNDNSNTGEDGNKILNSTTASTPSASPMVIPALKTNQNQHEATQASRNLFSPRASTAFQPASSLPVPIAPRTTIPSSSASSSSITVPETSSLTVLEEKLLLIRRSGFDKNVTIEAERHEYARHYEYTRELKKIAKDLAMAYNKRKDALNVLMTSGGFITQPKLDVAINLLNGSYRDEFDLMKKYYESVSHYKVNEREIKELFGGAIRFGHKQFLIGNNPNSNITHMNGVERLLGLVSQFHHQQHQSHAHYHN